jgi:hypothetical protein
MTNIIKEIGFGLARGFGIYIFERSDFAAPVMTPDLRQRKVG